MRCRRCSIAKKLPMRSRKPWRHSKNRRRRRQRNQQKFQINKRTDSTPTLHRTKNHTQLIGCMLIRCSATLYATQRLRMSSGTDRIEKKVVLRAPRERVWRAICDAKQFGSWFGWNLTAHLPRTPGCSDGLFQPLRIPKSRRARSRMRDNPSSWWWIALSRCGCFPSDGILMRSTPLSTIRKNPRRWWFPKSRKLQTVRC